MNRNDVGRQLHDKATQGVPLSAEEQALLAEWYARLDREESAQFAQAPVPASLATLRDQVSVTLTQIVAVSQRIQALNRENEALQKDITVLEQRLVQKAS